MSSNAVPGRAPFPVSKPPPQRQRRGRVLPKPTADATTIVWVDDDQLYLRYESDLLRDLSGWRVIELTSVKEGLRLLRSKRTPVSAVIVDVMMSDTASLDKLGTHGGYATGISLAREIRRLRPRVPILGMSQSPDFGSWFRAQQGMSFVPKASPPRALYEELLRLLTRRRPCLSLRTFIVHGHDLGLALELKNYLQTTLGLPEPILLQEQPDMGLTIIEKFETHADTVDFVLVLLTPDDLASGRRGTDSRARRARQNVIFEMGYFLGKFGRRSQRVLLLYKGPLELPSDIAGVTYIDVSSGIRQVSEALRSALLVSSRRAPVLAPKAVHPD